MEEIWKYIELNALIHFKWFVNVNDYLKKYRNEQGILIMGIYDFLLNDDSLDY